MKIEFLAEARADADEAFDWYFLQDRAVANRFVQALDRTLERISQGPLYYPAVDGRHRGCRLKRFPFKVVYRIGEQEILIVAVAHDKRNPHYWRARR